MYKLLCNRSFSTSLFSGKVFIRNKTLPICSKCVHFIEHTNNYPYDPPPSDKEYGKCRKFGEINLITGTIDHDLASDCRINSNKCGNTGLEYNEKNED